jgi:arginyl-tRNA synthetase
MTETAEAHTIALGKIEGFTEEQAKALYEIIGLGALKYFLLKVDPKKRMLFNPEESIQFQGNTAPFIQYTHARISAILRKADQLDIPYKLNDLIQYNTLQGVERDLIHLLSDFPEKVKLAGEAYSPSLIAQYVYDLAKEYNRFYAELSIFNEQDEQARAFRVMLSYMVAKVIKKSMSLLGIDVPDRM